MKTYGKKSKPSSSIPAISRWHPCPIPDPKH